MSCISEKSKIRAKSRGASIGCIGQEPEVFDLWPSKPCPPLRTDAGPRDSSGARRCCSATWRDLSNPGGGGQRWLGRKEAQLEGALGSRPDQLIHYGVLEPTTPGPLPGSATAALSVYEGRGAETVCSSGIGLNKQQTLCRPVPAPTQDREKNDYNSVFKSARSAGAPPPQRADNANGLLIAGPDGPASLS